MKLSNRWSDGSFKDLLMLLKDMLSQDNAVPETVYETKQIIYLLGLEVKKMHEYKNDCIIYHGAEYEDLEKCPICGLDWFNRRKDGGDDKNYNRRKGRPKRCFGTFLSFLVSSTGLQTKKELELL
jgi:hypothetical protein